MSTKLNHPNLNFISILCSCLVPLLVTGSFLPDLTLSLLSIWFLYYTFKNKIYYIYINNYFFFFITFCIVSTLSSILSDNIFFSLNSSLFYFRIGIFALLISYLIDQNTRILNYFYYALILTFFILILDGYFQFFTGSNILGYKSYTARLSSLFLEKHILGSYLSRLFPLLFAIFVVKKNKSSLEICSVYILFIATDVLIFLAGERASFLFLNLSTIFVIIFISKYKLFRLIIFVISLCIIIFLTTTNKKLYDRYILSVVESTGFDQVESRKYIFSHAHDSYFRTAWNMFLDKPILGHGPNSFRKKCSNANYAVGVSPCNTHPHNFYIQLLAETGLVGFSFLSGLFFYFLYLSIKSIKYFFSNQKLFSDYQICLLSGLLITIWPFTTNGNFFNNHLMILYSLQMGFFRKKL